MKYIVKKCKNKKCGVEFNTRPCYNKEYCRKCWNNIRMKRVYRELHPNARIIYVNGNETESKKQWARRNLEKARALKSHSEHIRRCRCKETDIDGSYILDLKKKTKVCITCGVVMSDNGRKSCGKTLDHRIPLCKGGKHIKSNVRVICRKCNIKKGSKLC